VSVTLVDDTICSGDPAQYVINSSYPLNSVGNVHWEWGDGPQDYPGPGYAGNYSHVYNTAGQPGMSGFSPAVTITNPDGCIATVSATAPTVIVLPVPVAFVSPAGPIEHCGAFSPETLTATITTGIGGNNDYHWSGPVGEPVPGNTPIWGNITHYGNYKVVVTNTNGCSSTSNTVSIIENCPSSCGPGTAPVISGNVSGTGCGNVHIDVTVTGGTAVNYTWTYDPSAHVNTQNATTLDVDFSVAGSYDFVYIAYYLNNNGDLCQVRKNFNAKVYYVPDLRYSVECNQAGGNYKVTLYDHTTVYGTSVPAASHQYYSALPPSGLIGSGYSMTVNLSAGTTHTLYETVTDGVHGLCTSSVQVTLPAFPHASFTPEAGFMNPGCVNSVPFNFINTSSPMPLSYWWDFGDLSYNTSQNAGRIYSTPGTPYNITLKVTDIYGCSSIASQSVTAVANNLKNGTVSANPTNPCLGSAVNLQFVPGAGSVVPPYYTWFNENTQLTGLQGPSLSVNTSGGYWVKGSDQYGCMVNTPITPVSFTQVPAVAISGGNIVMCKAGICITIRIPAIIFRPGLRTCRIYKVPL